MDFELLQNKLQTSLSSSVKAADILGALSEL